MILWWCAGDELRWRVSIHGLWHWRVEQTASRKWTWHHYSGIYSFISPLDLPYNVRFQAARTPCWLFLSRYYWLIVQLLLKFIRINYGLNVDYIAHAIQVVYLHDNSGTLCHCTSLKLFCSLQGNDIILYHNEVIETLTESGHAARIPIKEVCISCCSRYLLFLKLCYFEFLSVSCSFRLWAKTVDNLISWFCIPHLLTTLMI